MSTLKTGKQYTMKNCQLCCMELSEACPPKYSSQLYELYSKYLHPSFTQDDLLKQTEKSLAFCQSCFKSGMEIDKLAAQIEAFQKNITESVFVLSLEVLHRRGKSAVTNGDVVVTDVNSEKILLEFDVSSFRNCKTFSIPTLDSGAPSTPLSSDSEVITPKDNVDDIGDPLLILGQVDIDNDMDIGTEEVKFENYLENRIIDASDIEMPEVNTETRNIIQFTNVDKTQERSCNNATLVNFQKQTPTLKLHRLKFHVNGENCIASEMGVNIFKYSNELVGGIKSSWNKSDSESSYKIVDVKTLSQNEKRSNAQKQSGSEMSHRSSENSEIFRIEPVPATSCKIEVPTEDSLQVNVKSYASPVTSARHSCSFKDTSLTESEPVSGPLQRRNYRNRTRSTYEAYIVPVDGVPVTYKESKQHKCLLCGDIYKSKVSGVNHWRFIHDGQRRKEKTECQFCGKTYQKGFCMKQHHKSCKAKKAAELQLNVAESAVKTGDSDGTVMKD